eukprot:362638-Chlamydomonas_euryale.AAC.3
MAGRGRLVLAHSPIAAVSRGHVRSKSPGDGVALHTTADVPIAAPFPFYLPSVVERARQPGPVKVWKRAREGQVGRHTNFR